MENASYIGEKRAAWCAVLAGFAIALVIWNGRNMMNFVYTWVPQGVVLVAMLLLGARPAALAGAAVALAGYLVFFRWWVFTFYQTDGLVWLLYLFSLPGGLVGGIAVTRWLRNRDEWAPNAAALAAATCVLVGIVVNQICVRLTV